VRAFVHQRVDQALHDLVVGDVSGLDADFFLIGRNDLVHFWIRERLPVPGFVLVEALAGLLPKRPCSQTRSAIFE
jgi:hypothetical protein